MAFLLSQILPNNMQQEEASAEDSGEIFHDEEKN